MTSINIREINNAMTIQIVGKFNFEALTDFSQTVLSRNFSNTTQLTLDMGQVVYLDSSALGVLAALRRKLPSEAKAVIQHGNDSVRKTLATARFDQLFDIA